MEDRSFSLQGERVIVPSFGRKVSKVVEQQRSSLAVWRRKAVGFFKRLVVWLLEAPLGVFLFGGLFVAMSLSDSSLLPATPLAPSATGVNIPEQEEVRASVRSFLTAWLVERSLEKAMPWFGKAAFSNEQMLSDPCLGNDQIEHQASETERRAGVENFLRHFQPPLPATELGEVLSWDDVPDLVREMGSRLINDPSEDLFALVKLSLEELPVEDRGEGLPEDLPSYFYVSFVPLGGGIISFIWVPEGDDWRITHVSLMCV